MDKGLKGVVWVGAVGERGAVGSEELIWVVITWQADQGWYRGLIGVDDISVVS